MPRRAPSPTFLILSVTVLAVASYLTHSASFRVLFASVAIALGAAANASNPATTAAIREPMTRLARMVSISSFLLRLLPGEHTRLR